MYRWLWCQIASVSHLGNSKDDSFLSGPLKPWNVRSLLKQMRQNLLGATREGSSQRDAVLLPRFSTDPIGVDGATVGRVSSGTARSSWTLLRRYRQVLEVPQGREKDVCFPQCRLPCLERDKVWCLDPAFATGLMCYPKLLCWIQAGAHCPASWVEGADVWSASLQSLERPFAELSRAVSGLKTHLSLGAEVELWISTLFLEKHHLNCISKPFFFFFMGIKYSVGIFKILTFSWIIRQLRSDSS